MSYREQYDRMKRYYNRFSKIAEGQEHQMSADYYVDDIYSFFQNCYHLKDWLKNDAAVNDTTKQRVEDYINSKRSLILCADLCNSSKHLNRTSNRSNEDPIFGPKHYGVNVGVNSPTIVSLKYQIDLQGGGTIDAFQLATECVTDWQVFLKDENLL